MTDRHGARIRESLGAFGADLSRWPAERVAGAREALLARPDVRRAWEAEGALDRAIAAAGAHLDQAIADSGAAERVRRATLARLPHALAATPRLAWRRIAAAVLFACILGGTTDLLLSDPAAEATDFVMLDPLYAFDAAEVQ